MQYEIIRKIDKLGRVVIPKDIRKYFGMKEGSNVRIVVTETGVCFEKTKKSCDD